MYGSREVELEPVAAPALCTLADVKTALGITTSGSDTQLTGLIAAASAQIEAYCGQPIGRRTVTERRGAMETCQKCVLTYAPVVALASVSLEGEAQTLGDYRAALTYGFVAKTDRTDFTPGEWVFTYTVGYTSGAIPQDIADAALLLTKHLYNTAKGYAPAESIARESSPDIGDVTYRAAADRTMTRNGASLPADIALMLTFYVREF